MSLNWLATDAVNTFVSDFAEPIVYIPANGAPIYTQALIYRNPATAFAGLPGAAGYQHEIYIPVNALGAIQKINKGNDQVIFGNRIDSAAESFVVLQVIENDQGLYRLGVG